MSVFADDDWPTVDAIADHCGVPVDDRMRVALDAAIDWVIERRGGDRECPPRVFLGTCLYAAMLYQARTAWTTYADALTVGETAFGGQITRIRELIGGGKPAFG